MSRIRRLSIRGIRNFEEDHECMIHFKRPITLILGPNGTGKTTIIEALKYATSGEFPPGSDKGKYFVHNPYLGETQTTRGSVKAEVIDAQENVYTISRMVECSKVQTKTSTLRLKSLDSTITKENKATKQKGTITTRCADLDTELVSILGVSKPILNYVLFCHQEDFSWPFEDGKKLKEKFDEIFDSAAYNKALENIMKCSKELQSNLRILKSEKESFKNIVTNVEERESTLRKLKTRLTENTDKINDINGKLKPIIVDIRILSDRDTEYKKLSLEKEMKQVEYRVSEHECNKLRENIKEPFSGTLEELNDMIKSYDKTLLEKNKEKEELNEKLQNIITEETEIMKMLGEQKVKIGKLKQQLKDHESRVDARNKAMELVLSEFKLNMVDPTSETEINEMMTKLEAKLRDMERQIDDNRFKAEDEEKMLQDKVDKLRTRHSKIESELQLKEKEMFNTRDELDSLRAQIKQISAATNKLNSIELKLQQAKNKVDKLKVACNEDAIKKVIEDKIKLRDEIEVELNELDKTIAALHKQSSLQAELELHRSSVREKEDKIEVLRKKHENDIKTLLDNKTLPDRKLKDMLDQVHQKFMNKLRDLTREIESEQRQLTTLETTVSHNTNEMEQKISQIERDKEKISSVCSYENFDEILTLESKKLKSLQDKRGVYAYQNAAYGEYMKKLKSSQPCCPLCQRDFPDKDKLKDLIRDMEDEMVNHPDRLEQCEAEMKKQQIKYDNMLQLKPIVEKIIAFEETEAKKLRENLKNTKEHVRQSQKRIDDLQESKIELESKLNLYKKVIGDVSIWDQYLSELQKLNLTIEECESKLASAGITDNRSMKELQEKQESLKHSWKNAGNEIDALRERINKHKEEIQRAKEEHNALLEEHLKIRADAQKLSQLRDKENDLNARDILLNKSIDKLRDNLASAKVELNTEIQKLKTVKRQNQLNYDYDRKSAVEKTRLVADLQKMQNEIVMFLNRNVTDALEQSETKINEYQQSIENFAKDKSNLEKSMSKINEDVSQREIKKRELSDIIKLHKMDETVRKLKHELTELSEKLDSMNHKEMVERMQMLQRREDSLLREKNIIIGQREELERSISESTEELKKEHFRVARKNYFMKCAEVKICENSIADLISYGKVLDNTLIAYHEERMDSVNRVMKRLWRHVYKGTDTSSIEIRTEQTHGVGSSRRTYNYKLVQVKHGYEIGMKGRCSAGQKVLASIIIRLALAETFCKECGVLALDEPTTNLDEENVNSLAEALVSIVTLRAQYQKHFQLIVISHDENFLLKLADLNYHRSLYELYRKSNGYSAVKRIYISNGHNMMEQLSDDELNNENEENDNGKYGNAGRSRNKRPAEDDSDTETQPAKSTKRFVLQI